METKEQIAEIVKDLIVDCLSVDRDELTDSARFFHDLGGESIDVLDLQFHCEKRFGVKVEIQRMFGDSIEVDESGRVTPATLDLLRRRLPFLDMSAIGPDTGVEDLKQLLTVGAITHVVQDTVLGPAHSRRT